MKKHAVIILLIAILVPALMAETEDITLTKAGQKFFEAGKYTEAIEKYDQALMVNPDNYFTFQCSGEAYLKLGDKETALLQFERSYNINPSPKTKQYIDDLRKTIRRSVGILLIRPEGW